MEYDAASLMTQKLYTIGPDETVADAARMLASNDISAVPVCDRTGTLVGLISEGDLLKPFAESHELRRAWWLSLLAEGNDLAPVFTDYVRRDRRLVRDLMTSPVITAVESTTAPELSELLTTHRIKRVPIMRDGRMVGIVSRADIVRAMSRTPATASDWA